jgi:hypothetical protein
MDAAIYQLADIKSKRDIRTRTAAFYPTLRVADGLALLLTAQSFWARYALAVASLQTAILSSALSNESKSRLTQVVRYLWKSNDPQLAILDTCLLAPSGDGRVQHFRVGIYLGSCEV